MTLQGHLAIRVVVTLEAIRVVVALIVLWVVVTPNQVRRKKIARHLLFGNLRIPKFALGRGVHFCRWAQAELGRC